MPTNIKNQKGFIAIIAMAIFMLLAGFGIIMQKTSIETLNHISNTKKQYAAEDIANSIFEWARNTLNNSEAGFTRSYDCTTGTAGENCNEIPFIGDSFFTQNPTAQITVDIVGRNLSPSYTSTAQSPTAVEPDGAILGTSGAVYTVPAPGQGSAGARCSQYKPTISETELISNACVTSSANLNGSSNNCNPQYDDQDNTNPTIDQINYSCNWNKLSFGSELTSRVVIPLFYKDENYTNGEGFISPFHKNFNNGTPITDYALRVRTPCLPCASVVNGTPEEPVTGSTRACAPNQDPTICADTERYTLDVDDQNNDDVVLKWQIQAMCDPSHTLGADPSNDPTTYTEACGLLPVNSYTENDTDVINTQHSGITEGRINYGAGLGTNLAHPTDNNNDDTNNKVLYKSDTLQGQESKVGGQSNPLYKTTTFPSLIREGLLYEITKPYLILYLENPLISNQDEVIPYLEYQLITIGTPVSDSKTTTTAKVTLNGSTIQKTLTINNQSNLIDFAVQN